VKNKYSGQKYKFGLKTHKTLKLIKTFLLQLHFEIKHTVVNKAGMFKLENLS